MKIIHAVILCILCFTCGSAADDEKFDSENFTIRKLMSAVKENINKEYKVNLELSHENYEIYNINKESLKNGITVGGWTVLDLWVFAFYVDVENDNKSIEDKWITWYEGGNWKFDKYQRTTKDKLIDSDGNNETKYNKNESLVKPPPSKEETINIINAALQYEKLGERLGLHAITVQNTKYEEIFDEKTMKEIIGELNKTKNIFTLKGEDTTPFFIVTISKINSNLMFMEINRGFPLAGPIDGYWIANKKVIRRDGIGIK